MPDIVTQPIYQLVFNASLARGHRLWLFHAWLQKSCNIIFLCPDLFESATNKSGYTTEDIIGYTHYWHQPKTIKARVFDFIRRDIQAMATVFADEYGLPIAGPDGEGKPVFTPDLIAFNGHAKCGHKDYPIEFFGRTCAARCSHESFFFERVYEPWPGQKQSESVISFESTRKRRPTLWGSFCKTEYKPYDVLVTCALLIIKHHLGNFVVVRSDGEDIDFDDARLLCFARLGYGDKYILDVQHGLIEGYRQMSDAIAHATLATRGCAMGDVSTTKSDASIEGAGGGTRGRCVQGDDTCS